jgi:hypothetical protein
MINKVLAILSVILCIWFCKILLPPIKPPFIKGERSPKITSLNKIERIEEDLTVLRNLELEDIKLLERNALFNPPTLEQKKNYSKEKIKFPNLAIEGIIWGKERSTVVLRDKDSRRTYILQVGQIIKDGFKVEKITRNSITISKEGFKKKFYIKYPK